MFAHRYRYGFMLLLGVYSYLNTLYVEALTNYRIDAPEWVVAASITAIVVLVWESNRLLEAAVPTLRRRLPVSVHPLIVQFLGSLPLVLLTVTALIWSVATFYLAFTPDGLRLPLKLSLVFGFRVNLFLQTVNAVYFLLRQFRQAQLEAAELKKVSAQAQLQLLKAQINPHFLFNNFNVLSSLVDKDPKIAQEFIQQLASVYRYVLDQNNKELVTLGEEMQFLRSYGYLLNKRFNGGLRINFDVPDSHLHYYIVPVALQMVFENAIKHNVNSHSRPLHIRVSVDDSPSIIVVNNIQPKADVEPSTRVGLANIRQRYQFITKRTIHILRTEDTFRVILPLLPLPD